MKTTNASRELTVDELNGVSAGTSLGELAVGLGIVAGYKGTTYLMEPTVGEIAKKVVTNHGAG